MHVDVKQVDAQVCYTFDGGGANQIDVETFSADLAIVKFQGINIHPSIAKDKMVNAMRMVGAFLERMPARQSPEQTDGRQGFLHPYSLESGVGEASLKVILRSFDSADLKTQVEMLQSIAAEVSEQYLGGSVTVEARKQYRNMAEGLSAEPRAVEFAIGAHERLNRRPEQSIIRGGTDGSQLTEMGLPTPNLSSGQHNVHSKLEFACLDEMVQACEVGVEIVKIWAEKG